MSTELEQRLRRLAADVDLDQGRVEQRARQARLARRRVLVGSAAAAVVAVVTVTGVALLARSAGDGDGDGDDDLVAGPEPEAQTTSAMVGSIEIELTAPSEAEAGSRLWFDVVVRNAGDAAVYWNAGGCTIPVQAAVGLSSTVGTGEQGPDAEDPRWDGDAGTLGSWLADHNVLSTTQGHQPATMTGRRQIACTSDLRPEPLEPGGELRHRGSVELRVPPGDLPGGGRYELVAGFRAYPDDAVVGDRASLVEVRAALTVADDPRRTAGSSDEAVDAFAADPRLADWIASTEVAGRPDLVQDFGTELSWWRGAWELRVDAYWDDHRPLRMRYDPASGEVVDVRTVSMNQAPEDEPGRSTIPDEEPDEIL
jgi:hypothetical protein